MDFNDGSLSIAVFGANLTDKEYAHFIYDFDNNDSVPYVARQKNHVIGLLDAASVDCQITNFFIVTWMNYSYCDTHVSQFQLVLILFYIIYLAVEYIIPACNSSNFCSYLCTVTV